MSFHDPVVRQLASILKLIACIDKALMVRGDPLLVLYEGFDGVDGVGGLNVERDANAVRLRHDGLHHHGEVLHVQVIIIIDHISLIHFYIKNAHTINKKEVLAAIVNKLQNHTSADVVV